jgi:retron-type reverse transcriptase
MAHSWIIRFLEPRIADKRILRLIAKWLKVGTIEDGRRTRGVCGAPQGAMISPILANVYLHYVFDLWVHRWRLFVPCILRALLHATFLNYNNISIIYEFAVIF